MTAEDPAQPGPRSGPPGPPGAPGSPAARRPDRVGPYRLLHQVGSGGMGVVHLALDPASRAVAVKVLRPHLAADPAARERLAREGETLRRVRSPRVAEVLDTAADADPPYVVTQFVAAPPLDEHVAAAGPLSGAPLARLGLGLGEALAAVHRAGVVHRDLKPGNVLVDEDGPVVIDFGIAQIADDVRLTSTGLVMGTPGYLSPEVLDGAPVSAAGDWWAWAATTLFAATGRPPFGTGPSGVVLGRVQRGAPDLEGVAEPFAALLAAALSADPADRPTPRALREALTAVVDAGAAGAAPQPAPLSPSAPPLQPAPLPPPADGPVPPPPPVPDASPDPAPLAVAGEADPSDAREDAGAEGDDAADDDRWATVALPRAASPAGPSVALAPPPPPPRAVPPPPTEALATSPPTRPYPVRQAPGPREPLPDPDPYSSRRHDDRHDRPRPAGPPRPEPDRDARPLRDGDEPHGGAVAPRSGAEAARDGGAAPPRVPGRGWVVALLGASVAAVAALVPATTVLAAAVVAVGARTLDRTVGGLHRRRSVRGARGSDATMTVLAAPAHLVAATLVTAAALLLPLLMGISAAFITGWALSGDSPRPGGPLALAVGTATGLLTAWWGPGGGSLRRGTRLAVLAVTPGRSGVAVALGVLALVLLSAALVAAAPDHLPDWSPLDGPPLGIGAVSAG